MKSASHTVTKLLSPLLVGSFVVLATHTGCKKEEPPPPLPAATAEPAPTVEQLVLAEEDAGADAEEDSGKKPTGPWKPGPSLKACCNALQQNAASAPPPNNAYMMQAAATCHALVAQGKGRGTILGAIRAALKGAGMPSACH